MGRYYAPFQTALDSNGDPISGAKLYFYQTGTTTKLTTYSDSALTTANTNPVIADSAGRFGDIYLSSSSTYKVVLKDENDVLIKTTDPLDGTASGSSICDVKAFGAVGDGVTNDHDAIALALACAANSVYGTGAVFFPRGHYKIDTDDGTLTIQEGVEMYGEGGIQVRRPGVQLQGTVIDIVGTTNSPFTYERGTYIHNLSFDYSDEEEDPVTPTTYPYCFQGDASTNGAKSFFENLYFDRCFKGFEATGGTAWTGVHGCFYNQVISIINSSAVCRITDCSFSSVWHRTTNTNLKAYQQDNLKIIEVDGGADGLIINGMTVYIAKIFLSLVNGDGINFFRMGDYLLDGVPDLIWMDTDVIVYSMQFSNGMHRMYNDWGSTSRISPCVFDGYTSAASAGQVVHFQNCRFRVSPGGVFSVESGITLILDGCSFFDWNVDAGASAEAMSVVYMNHASANLVVNGGSADNNTQYNLAVESRLVTVDAANRVTVNGMDLFKVKKIVNVSAGVTLPYLSCFGNTGKDIDNPIAMGAGASVTYREVAQNNWEILNTETIASDTTITIAKDESTLAKVTGTTAIEGITESWTGRIIVLKFGATCTVSDNADNILLRDSRDFVGEVSDCLTLVYDGSNWYETSRSRNVTLTTLETLAAATEITIDQDHTTVCTITGTTQIDTITPSWAGKVIILKFASTPTVKDGADNLVLAGADFVATAQDTLTLFCDGVKWIETSRSVN